MKKWNSQEFGFIESKISSLESFMQSLDNEENHQNLEENELQDRQLAQIELQEWIKRESFWAQKSRAQWLKEGDRNTRNFHAIASIRKRKNAIESMTKNGTILNNPFEIRKAVTNYFKIIFTEKSQKRPMFENLDFNQFTLEQAENLISPFFDSEINAAVSTCAYYKPPEPDDFNFRFIKNAWEIIKDDVYIIVKEFLSSSILSNGSNIAFIALI